MTPDNTEALLRQSATGGRSRTPTCPDEHLVSGFAEGSLGNAYHAQVAGHVADCAACASLVGELARHLQDSTSEVVPELTLARARRLGGDGLSGRMPFVPQLAAAAIAVVCISTLFHFMRVDSPAAPPEDLGTDRTTRNIAAVGAALQLLSPAAGATLEPGALDVRWTGVPAASYYDVRIVTDAGEIVSEQRVSSTGWRPGNSVELQPGADYYVRVEAYVAGARSVRSEHVPFRSSSANENARRAPQCRFHPDPGDAGRLPWRCRISAARPGARGGDRDLPRGRRRKGLAGVREARRAFPPEGPATGRGWRGSFHRREPLAAREL